jgi:hypothetical protein
MPTMAMSCEAMVTEEENDRETGKQIDEGKAKLPNVF